MDHHTQPTYEMTPGFKHVTKNTQLPTLFPLCFSLKLSYWTTTGARYLSIKIKNYSVNQNMAKIV